MGPASLHGYIPPSGAKLPDKLRQAVALFYFQGMDLAAAAQTLGIPVGTMKSRLNKARKLLKGQPPQGAAVGVDADFGQPGFKGPAGVVAVQVLQDPEPGLLGIPVGTMKSRLNKARKLLKEALADETDLRF